MNRVLCGRTDGSIRVPRMRGDEPTLSEKQADKSTCSPHARG